MSASRPKPLPRRRDLRLKRLSVPLLKQRTRPTRNVLRLRKLSVSARSPKKRLNASPLKSPWKNLESLRQMPSVRKRKPSRLSGNRPKLKPLPRRRGLRLMQLNVLLLKLPKTPRRKDSRLR